MEELCPRSKNHYLFNSNLINSFFEQFLEIIFFTSALGQFLANLKVKVVKDIQKLVSKVILPKYKFGNELFMLQMRFKNKFETVALSQSFILAWSLPGLAMMKSLVASNVLHLLIVVNGFVHLDMEVQNVNSLNSTRYHLKLSTVLVIFGSLLKMARP